MGRDSQQTAQEAGGAKGNTKASQGGARQNGRRVAGVWAGAHAGEGREGKGQAGRQEGGRQVAGKGTKAGRQVWCGRHRQCVQCTIPLPVPPSHHHPSQKAQGKGMAEMGSARAYRHVTGSVF